MLPAVNLFAEDILPPLIVFDGYEESSKSLNDFETVYRGPVSFTHGKHVDDYKLECGQCHHDDSGEPLKDFRPSDEIDNCIDCHYLEGLLRGQILAETSQEEVLEHYPNAIHQMCISCHQERNNLTHTLFAPEACRGCHAQLLEEGP